MPVISGKRAVTQHIWARLPQKSGSSGCSAGAALAWERCTAALGSGGRRQAPEPRVPGSLRAGVSRETRRLLLMQHNSPSSLPFSHNKHTAKSLASCFDEATCISPFSVYRKLLLKKVILVFTARVKGPGRLPSLPAGLRAAQEGPGGAARPGRCERHMGRSTLCSAFSLRQALSPLWKGISCSARCIAGASCSHSKVWILPGHLFSENQEPHFIQHGASSP